VVLRIVTYFLFKLSGVFVLLWNLHKELMQYLEFM
jgi:hypothetical protein